ncbi:hypothetical protein OsI_14420 [Oryza sativa Indica Group]|uniref:Uncharacterized protein n=1 Tax=Oryza sativa subsp. indica TaxID=39946 RepID=B8ANT3_ORYSI|nr:hypothetical protein OsI_14420 [Oryza sativa Indica Group]
MAPPPPCCVLVVRCCSGSLPSPPPPPPPPPRPSPSNNLRIARREFVLRSSELATLAAIFHLSGTKPRYLGVQKSPPSLALCPATNNCVSTCEDITDSIHYAPPWNYNPKDGRRAKPITKHEAINQLIQVVTQTKPDNFTPRLVEKTDDYVRVEYESPIFGFVDDVEFWFPPGNKSIVQYRSASRSGFIDFNANKKRVKALRLALENKGWASESTI